MDILVPKFIVPVKTLPFSVKPKNKAENLKVKNQVFLTTSSQIIHNSHTFCVVPDTEPNYYIT